MDPAPLAGAAALLAPLRAPITSLPSLGPGLAGLLVRAIGGPTLLDLLFHLPEGLIDRRYRPRLVDARPGHIATLAVTVQRLDRPQRPRQPWRVLVGDGTGTADLVFFSPHQARGLIPGTELLVSGRLERYGNRLSMAHPDHLLPRARAGELPPLEAAWPLTTGLLPRVVARSLRAALDRLPDLPEWLEPSVVAREGWPGFAQALHLLHFPGDSLAGSDDGHLAGRLEAARERLGCDELLASQVAMVRARRRSRERPGRSLAGDGSLRRLALASFGHQPTPAQRHVLAEIDADLAAPTRMLRLLQGDVGAGKTLVALLAMLRAAECGLQSALMVPTEILARQHHATLERLSPVPVALLTGSIKGRARRQALDDLATGRVQLAVGTHALFQHGVAFADLALAVIDEQHRFGVEQRLMLGDKGEQTDILAMTATPIPRTLLLTQWGEMQVSRLDGKPPGRKPIRTSLHPIGAIEEVCAGIARALAGGAQAGGAQAFWVCPLVSESELLDVAAAEARHAALTARFGVGRVGLAHGRQDVALREAALADFAAGRTRILVATTVIEVGVDVRGATIMVIEHAERFGLAQLHQLRGRVGRGGDVSYCLLLHDDALAGNARQRLSLLRETEDGFLIADEDHRLRGGGDLMGRRQSGLPGFRLAAGPRFDELLRLAWQDAEMLLDRDATLSSARGRAVGLLLDLFGRADALRTLHSG
ncbi:ATP-dependent DNA helicase RecG [Lichenicoccus sp.]|uniref:ATP-dependent DNA helicase RecG n=1 Tax=Lichenicoccus sp. TaxID=2781899 RepID=UPI003D0B3048